MPRKTIPKRKNPAAVALGRLGGLKSGGIKNLSQEKRSEIARKGGHARAEKLTPEQLSASARKAVRARWQKKKAEVK
jgi:hypothetical protein